MPEHNAEEYARHANGGGDDEEDAVRTHKSLTVLRQIVDQGARRSFEDFPEIGVG